MSPSCRFPGFVFPFLRECSDRPVAPRGRAAQRRQQRAKDENEGADPDLFSGRPRASRCVRQLDQREHHKPGKRDGQPGGPSGPPPRSDASPGASVVQRITPGAEAAETWNGIRTGAAGGNGSGTSPYGTKADGSRFAPWSGVAIPEPMPGRQIRIGRLRRHGIACAHDRERGRDRQCQREPRQAGSVHVGSQWLPGSALDPLPCSTASSGTARRRHRGRSADDESR